LRLPRIADRTRGPNKGETRMRTLTVRVLVLIASFACPFASSEAAPRVKQKRPSTSDSGLIWFKAGNDQGVVRIGMKRIEPRPVKSAPEQSVPPSNRPAPAPPPLQPALPPAATGRLDGTSVGFFAGMADPVEYWRFTAQVSHLKSAGNLMYGVSGEAATERGAGGSPCSPASACSAQARWTTRVSGVVGYQMHRVTPYVTVGRVVTSFSGNAISGEGSLTKIGWTYSGGVKIPINDSWSGDVEFRRDAYGAVTGTWQERDSSRSQVRIGLQYRFAPASEQK
jgi:opacity protein-like surface antigen